jgi:hypothetical protein
MFGCAASQWRRVIQENRFVDFVTSWFNLFSSSRPPLVGKSLIH